MKYQDFYFDYLKHYEMPLDEREYLENVGNIIFSKYNDDFQIILHAYFSNGFHIELLEDVRKELANKSNISYYTINFILLVCAASYVKDQYLSYGCTEKIFYDTFGDLMVKSIECKKNKGVYGNFVEFWYPIFYNVKIFRLGRLEFELIPYKGNFHGIQYASNCFPLGIGDLLLSVHIPSGEPLTEQSRLESYKLAYDFFKNYRKDGKIFFICSSWLLYPKFKEILPLNSNIVKFLDDWEIIEVKTKSDFPDAWRVFNKPFDGNTQTLPQKTTLQRSIAEWLGKGNPMGTGFGIQIFDGNKRINL